MNVCVSFMPLPRVCARRAGFMWRTKGVRAVAGEKWRKTGRTDDMMDIVRAAHAEGYDEALKFLELHDELATVIHYETATNRVQPSGKATSTSKSRVEHSEEAHSANALESAAATFASRSANAANKPQSSGKICVVCKKLMSTLRETEDICKCERIKWLEGTELAAMEEQVIERIKVEYNSTAPGGKVWEKMAKRLNIKSRTFPDKSNCSSNYGEFITRIRDMTPGRPQAFAHKRLLLYVSLGEKLRMDGAESWPALLADYKRTE